MANLIKLSSGLVLNLDNVTHIHNARVYLVYPPTEYADNFVVLTDNEAEMIHAWLDWQARDIAAELAGRKEGVATLTDAWQDCPSCGTYASIPPVGHTGLDDVISRHRRGCTWLEDALR